MPVYVVPAGYMVIVQVPVEGNPVKTILPEILEQFGCVIALMAGVTGVIG